MTETPDRPTTAEQFAEFFKAAMPARDLDALFTPEITDTDTEETAP